MKPSTKMFVVAGICGIFFIICLFGLEGGARSAAMLPGILCAAATFGGLYKVGNDW